MLKTSLVDSFSERLVDFLLQGISSRVSSKTLDRETCLTSYAKSGSAVTISHYKVLVV
jgi:hypothetical protein